MWALFMIRNVKKQRPVNLDLQTIRFPVTAIASILHRVSGVITFVAVGILLSPFDVVIWMTDGWPLYESRLKGKLHVISKRYTQRIERHNLNLRQHLARLGRKSLSFSKSVELHDKVIGHYLNIKHYQ
jgi:IS1 family transposase